MLICDWTEINVNQNCYDENLISNIIDLVQLE